MCILQFHPAFLVVDKILTKLAKQRTRQRRGLEQRGVAHQDVNLAKEFLRYLESQHLLITPKARPDQVRVTDEGRPIFAKYERGREIDQRLLSFFFKDADQNHLNG